MLLDYFTLFFFISSWIGPHRYHLQFKTSQIYNDYYFKKTISSVYCLFVLIQMIQNRANDSSVSGIKYLSLQQFVIEEAKLASELHTQNEFTTQRLVAKMRSVELQEIFSRTNQTNQFVRTYCCHFHY